jgi:hypothetical protein
VPSVDLLEFGGKLEAGADAEVDRYEAVNVGDRQARRCDEFFSFELRIKPGDLKLRQGKLRRTVVRKLLYR